MTIEYQASAETDIAIAERILKRPGPFKIDERGVARGEYGAEVPLFSSADAVAVAFLLPKLIEKCGMVIQLKSNTAPADVFPMEERIIVELGFKDKVVMAKAPRLALALCRAALMMADAVSVS